MEAALGHVLDVYAASVVAVLRDYMGHDYFFFKQEIIDVPGLLSAFVVTYEGVRDDAREVHELTPEAFLQRMSKAAQDWESFDLHLVRQMAAHQVMGGWEGRTIYFIKTGRHLDQWTAATGIRDVTQLLNASACTLGSTIQLESDHLREIVPVGREHFQKFERMVRVIFNFLFRGELGDGRPQSRTEPENEGLEIRDFLFANRADHGFWRDLKQKVFRIRNRCGR